MNARSKIRETNGKTITTLQNTVGTIILENTDGRPRISIDTDASNPIYKAVTVFTLMYRLITFFPVRFPDREVPHSHSTFGFHPNAWSAAYLLIVAFKARRGKHRKLGVPQYTLGGKSAGNPYQLGTVRLLESDGLVRPEQKASVENTICPEDLALQNDEIERALDEWLGVGVDGEDGDASAAEVKKALSTLSPDFLEGSSENGTQGDPEGILGHAVSGMLESVVEQSYQYMGETSDSPFINDVPLTEKQTDALIRLMQQYAGIRVNTTVSIPDSLEGLLPGKTNPDSTTPLAHVQQREEQIDQIQEQRHLLETTDSNWKRKKKKKRPSKKTVDSSARRILELTKKLTGGFEPDGRQYAAIIKRMKMGSEKEPRHPAAEKDAPPLRPHQAVDSCWVCDKSHEPAGFVVLASDCGTGKTLTALTALATAVLEFIELVKAGKAVAADGEPLYKPSFYLCPPSLVHQVQGEWRTFFRSFFNLYTCYGTSDDKDLLQGDTIISNSPELKNLLQKLRAKSDDPETAKTIILIPYQTARTRLVQRVTNAKSTKKDSQIEGDCAVDKETQATKTRTENQGKQRKRKNTTQAARQIAGISTIASDEEVSDHLPEQNDEADTDVDGGVRKAALELIVPDLQAFWVICDEAHIVKNPTSRVHRLVDAIQQDFLLLVTATPLGFGYKIGQEDARLYYEPETWEAIQKSRSSSNGISLERCIGKSDGANDDVSTFSARQLQRRAEFEKCIRSGKLPLFRLHPALFHAFAEKARWDIDVALEAIQPIMQYFSIRRGMMSELVLSDGTVVRPGDGIPPMTIKTVELEGSPDTIKIMKKNIEYLCANLHGGGGPGVERMTNAGIIKKDSASSVNFGTLSKIALSGFHADFFGFISASSRNIKLLGNPQCRRALSLNDLATDAGAEPGDEDRDCESDEHAGTKVTSAEVDDGTVAEELELDSEAVHAKVKTESGSATGITPGGVEECNLVRMNDVLGGLRFFFYLFRKSRAHIFPTTKIALAQTFCAHSPKLARTVQRALESKKEGKRLVLFSKYPATCLLVEALLNAIGVRTLSMRSENSIGDRSRFIQKFQDPNSKVDAMVTTFALGAFGLNLHACCHNGIILEEPINMGTKLQTIGRLHRIGQEQPINWEILYSRYTFDGYLLARSIDKYVSSVASESNLDPRITGQIASLCLHELVRIQFGLEFNTYPLSRYPWYSMDAPAARRECLFYSALAQAILSSPELAENLTKADVRVAALRWEVGKAVTRDMLNGTAPIAENGVTVTAFVSDEEA
ncbi:hypothetical protein PWT90_09934 [Aphanocladium album]|nr:hypothetical protein PWT90_09934 [Aphanocladium album]